MQTRTRAKRTARMQQAVNFDPNLLVTDVRRPVDRSPVPSSRPLGRSFLPAAGDTSPAAVWVIYICVQPSNSR